MKCTKYSRCFFKKQSHKYGILRLQEIKNNNLFHKNSFLIPNKRIITDKKEPSGVMNLRVSYF